MTARALVSSLIEDEDDLVIKDFMHFSYSAYTVTVEAYASAYGGASEEDDADAEQIANRLQKMIEAKFPGINVIQTKVEGIRAATTGPDESVVDEIDSYIDSVWTTAL